MIRRAAAAAAALALLMPSGSRAQAAPPQFPLQIGVVTSFGLTSLLAQTRVGADCSAGVRYDRPPVVAIALASEHATIVLIGWAWQAQPSVGVARVVCTWHDETRAATVRFSQGTTYGASSVSTPITPAPVGSTILQRWVGGDTTIYPIGTNPARLLMKDMGPRFSAHGAFSLTATLAIATSHQIAEVIAVGVQTTGGTIEQSGLASPDAGHDPVTQRYRFSQIDCERGCQLWMLDALNVDWTVTITQ